MKQTSHAVGCTLSPQKCSVQVVVKMYNKIYLHQKQNNKHETEECMKNILYQETLNPVQYMRN